MIVKYKVSDFAKDLSISAKKVLDELNAMGSTGKKNSSTLEENELNYLLEKFSKDNSVKRLFELEVPEIYDGTVEVKAISREAGARTKMAVWSKDANVNPVSACIGPHGDRVAAVVEKLGGEKIDIVKWSEDISEFISAALSPAKVVKVELLPGETRSCRVTVPDQQLSLAIGNKGQNARLCARLTGYNIDIRPESGYYGEEEPKAAEAEKTEDTAAE